MKSGILTFMWLIHPQSWNISASLGRAGRAFFYVCSLQSSSSINIVFVQIDFLHLYNMFGSRCQPWIINVHCIYTEFQIWLEKSKYSARVDPGHRISNSSNFLFSKYIIILLKMYIAMNVSNNFLYILMSSEPNYYDT